MNEIEDIKICDEELNKENPDARFGKHLLDSLMKLWAESILKKTNESN